MRVRIVRITMIKIIEGGRPQSTLSEEASTGNGSFAGMAF
jgi:hypothetical protein